MKSLSLRSELLVLDGLSHVTDMGDYWVQQTPAEPDFWMGNQLILKRDDLDLAALEVAFQAHFPGAKHRAMVWDIPGLDANRVAPPFETAGYERDLCDALTLAGEIAQADVPKGITLRRLETEQDWGQALALALEIGVEEGHPADSHVHYLQRRNTGRRQQIARGLGQWFGAFDGDLLVAQMGMFHDADVARYQHVETRKSHRRRGICAALLRHCRLWVLDRAPDATPVIVAETDGAAGRLYRRMGFAHTESIVGVLRKAY